MARFSSSIIPHLRRIFPLGLLMFAAILPIIVSNGLPAGADVSIHFWRTFDLSHSWAAGDWLARWSELFYTGYGAPSFAYTGGAFYALATIMGELFGLGDVTRVKVAWALSVILLISGTQRFTARRWGWASGWVATTLLVFSPALYHTEALGRGSFGVILGFGGAMMGLALLQDIAYGITRRIWPAAICIGVMMLAHNLTALQSVAVVGGWLVWATLFERAKSPALHRAWLTFLLGLGLSGVLWVPALLDSGMTRLAQMGSDANLDFRNHFIALPLLFDSGQMFDARLINNPPHHRLGFPHLILGISALIGLMVMRRRWREVAPWLILTTVSVFLVLPESRTLWERLTPLQQFLFPQRFLNTAAIGLALMGGFALSCLPIGRTKTLVTLIILAGGIAYGYGIGQTRWRTDFPEQATVQNYFDYELTTGIYGGTSANEFLPPTVLLIPGSTGFLMDSLAEGRPAQRINPYTLPTGTVATITQSSPTGFTATITTESPLILEILQTYSPLWQARLDGIPLATYPSEPYGFTVVNIPSGDHTLTLSYPLSNTQWAGLWLTIGAFGGIMFITWVGRGERGKIIAPLFVPQPTRGVLTGLMGIVVVSIALYLGNGFQMRSEVGESRIAMTHTDLTFANGQRLLGYTLHRLQPDALWELSLYWETPADEVALNSFVHVLDEQGQIIAQQDKLDIELAALGSGKYISDRYLLRFTSPPRQTTLRVGLWVCASEVNTFDCPTRRDLGVELLTDES